jgi:cytochrome c553
MSKIMKNLGRLIAIAAFFSLALSLFFSSCGTSGRDVRSYLKGDATPTPATAPPAGDKTIPETFTLCKDSLSEYGESAFNHANHAFKNYSPDGKSVMGCVECHHTDQPKSALKPPLSTSERDVAMTFEVWKASSQKVSDCRTCHFQDGNVPEGKTMPTATYTDDGKTTTKSMNNELAYHINCNTCHDAAFKLRPELKQKPGFSTSKDCTICYKSQ